MGSPTQFLTLNTSEWDHTLAPSLRDEGVCSLSDVLEANGSVPRRFYLSAKACQGILRRAAKRGRNFHDIAPNLTNSGRASGAAGQPWARPGYRRRLHRRLPTASTGAWDTIDVDFETGRRSSPTR